MMLNSSLMDRYGDYNGRDRVGYIAWNVGLLDEGLEAANQTCAMDTVPTCFDSCVHKCSRCAWSSCVDDIHFIHELVAQLRRIYSVSEIFLTGVSNGGMFTHYVASRLPRLARAVVPIYGLPLAQRLRVPQTLSGVAIMQIHDRGDKTIPWEGGLTGDGWIYEALTTVLSVWAQRHQCKSSTRLRGVATPFDGGAKFMVCQEYHKCQDGRVISCFYDGQHGSWPPHIEDLSWWFLSQYVSSTRV